MTRRAIPGRPHPDSPGEQALWARREELPGFHFNYFVMGFMVDLVNYEARVVVEVDGWTYHVADREQAERDRERDRLLQLGEYIPLRWMHDEVVNDTDRVLAQIAEQVDRAMRRKAWLERMREHHEAKYQRRQEELERLAGDRARVYEIVREMGNFVQQAEGPDEAAKHAKGMNRLLADRFGKADARTDDGWRAALVFVDDLWLRMRAEHGISRADIPPARARSCPACRMFHSENDGCHGPTGWSA